MKILHVWDAAGVSGCLAKYQRKLCHDGCVVVRDGYDVYGLQNYYGVAIVGPKRRRGLFWRSINVFWFYCYIAWCAWRFDVVHIHSQYLIWFFLPFKTKVLEFHGTDVRRNPTKRWGIDVAVTTIFLKLFKEGVIN